MNILKEFETFLNEDLPTKEIDKNKFPNPATKNDPSFFKKGKEDGDFSDDVVDTKKTQIPANRLKPSQDAVYLGKALGLAIGGVSGGDLDAIISKDNRILDGHHRWAATMFTNPATKIGGSKADMKIGDLVPVLRQAGDALGNKRGEMPKGGDVNIFLATKKDVEDAIYNGLNMDPKYYDKDKSVAWYEKNKSNVLKGLKMIQSTPPPDGAPPRVDMPKIEPNQVDKVAKALSGGRIDVRPPYKTNESSVIKDFDTFINEASSEEKRFGREVWLELKKNFLDKNYTKKDVLNYAEDLTHKNKNFDDTSSESFIKWFES